jgi:hypothetical protein
VQESPPVLTSGVHIRFAFLNNLLRDVCVSGRESEPGWSIAIFIFSISVAVLKEQLYNACVTCLSTGMQRGALVLRA